MPPMLTTVVNDMYDRLQTLTEHAGVSFYRVAKDADVTVAALYQLKYRTRKDGQSAWSRETLDKLSRVLAPRLNRKPGDVYAYLSGIETDLKL